MRDGGMVADSSLSLSSFLSLFVSVAKKNILAVYFLLHIKLS